MKRRKVWRKKTSAPAAREAAVTKLISDAARAEELIPVDELEAHAAKGWSDKLCRGCGDDLPPRLPGMSKSEYCPKCLE